MVAIPVEECPNLQVLRRGKTLTAHEDVFIRKDGTFFDVVYSSAPLREDGNITGLVVVFRDVTARKQAEKALRQAHEQLADRAKQLQTLVKSRTAKLASLTNSFAVRWPNAKPCVASYFTRKKRSGGALLASCTIRWDRI
jgi:PAS domain S-box